MGRVRFKRDLSDMQIAIFDEEDTGNQLDTTTGDFKAGDVEQFFDWEDSVGGDGTTVDLRYSDAPNHLLRAVPLDAVEDLDGDLHLILPRVPYTDTLSSRFLTEQAIGNEIFAAYRFEHSLDEDTCQELGRVILYRVLRQYRPDVFEDFMASRIDPTQEILEDTELTCFDYQDYEE
jgi:hypothetical protein